MDEAIDHRDQAVDGLHTVPVSEDLVADSSSLDPIELDIDGSSSIPVYELYNNYAYRVGFSVRKGNQRCKVYSKTVQMKMFMCSKAGFKFKANTGVKAYSKIDIRTGCGACVQFDVGKDGLWTVTKHIKVHNHELCAVDKSHLLRSHRNVGDNQLLYLKDLKKIGVAMADGIRFLKHQAGGSPLIGFTNRDAYNSIASDTLKRLDGTDSNSLIEIFRKRQSIESDFFFDFEVDCDLRLCNTEAGFEFYWTRLVADYKCPKNTWIQKLYDYREKWCPTFNKDYFSGGILSSQRSETTNHSISRRLSKTAGLCDFYSSFVSVISEWRSKENGEDFRCAQGVPTMMMEHVRLLLHARDVYTIEIYYLFEEQFMKGNVCHQEMVLNDGFHLKYHVRRPDIEIIRHEVSFKLANLDISCGCKLISELGILCCHCLRILHVHCVSSIPDKYIMKMWTKKVADGRNMNIGPMFYKVGVPPSIWVVEISRKFQRLIASSQANSVTRQFCDEAVEDAKKKVEAEIGYVHIGVWCFIFKWCRSKSFKPEIKSRWLWKVYPRLPEMGTLYIQVLGVQSYQFSNDLDDNAVVD
ncbi:PREDICTED: protein FAR1-RELATED SEQUENCE 7-like [Ipomoea nil]|uniref:protein FAR1-RELATED SEQUENCE 7-like n=1 Tax=Ipomoea nil TaxID=35883 RepID=UPI0009018794|nr:PREDICTED: protein FAR1-RELATED SEQUENCE 7-like [Ipomoea nil]